MVFENARAYTIIIRASGQPNTRVRLTRVPAPPSHEALEAARRGGSPLTAELLATEFDEEPWSLSLPAEAALLRKLENRRPTLRAVSGQQIFQGPITGADHVFRAHDVGPDPDHPNRRLVRPLLLPGHAPGVAIERRLLRPVVAGRTDLRRFRFEPSGGWLILPYQREREQDRYELIPPWRLERDYPAAYEWLARNEPTLRARSGAWSDENWVGYSRRQNLERFDAAKVLVPYMSDQLCAAYDQDGHFFVNVTTGGYGVGLSDDYGVEAEFLAALLNSELLSWTISRYARTWRGEYAGARGATLARLPIAIPDGPRQGRIVEAYQHCQRAARELAEARADRDRESLGRVYGAAVRAFDGAVVELYDVDDEEISVVRGG
jgi:hypothetical protein